MNRDHLITLVYLLFLVGFTSIDVIGDLKDGLEFSHLFHELLILVSALLIVAYKVFVIVKKDKLILKYEEDHSKANEEIDFYKKKTSQYKKEMSEIIGQQFKIWGLTESEKDVALLLIKGLSMKEISSIRGSSDATVRQQSTSIYKKSQLENRNQLASYFLEDLF